MPSSLTCTGLAAWTLAAVALQILGLSLFVIGFFPVKPTLPGLSGPESYRMPTCDPAVDSEDRDLAPDDLRSLYGEMSKIPPAFDRLILMVVDGLPAELVLGRGDKPPTKVNLEAMPYTQSLLSEGRATAYHAKAAPPTVTMPRLKAMVSGAIGGFLDVAFNFNTQAMLDDNLLDQFYRIGWKLVMHGDETWIKLFPGLFIRQDGVSSFYVKDTVEVDWNVSRHLEFELAANDWNLLILHYLGLDHVGHIGGRHSNLMAPKLKEMDEVIKMIHTHKILQQENLDRRTLLVVLSDHGMTDGGNHGGSSYEETDSLALFIGLGAEVPNYAPRAHDTIFQVDIAPTLALLFGVPIPNNNVGVLLAEAFISLTDEQILHALELNSWQLLRLLRAYLPSLLCGDLSCSPSDKHALQTDGSIGIVKKNLCHLFSRARAAHNFWKHHHDSGFIPDNNDGLMVGVGSYYDFLGNASEWLSLRATDKPINMLLSGVILMLISCVLLLNLLFCLCKEVYFMQKKFYPRTTETTDVWRLDEVFVFLGILIHVLSLAASSMVEEEQYTWHYLTSTLYLIFLFRTIQSLLRRQGRGLVKIKGAENLTFHHLGSLHSGNDITVTNYNSEELEDVRGYFYQISSILLVLICGRILRGWHQGGVNWIHLPDVSKWLEQAGSFSITCFQITSLLVVMILSSILLCLVRSRRNLVWLIFLSHLLSGFMVLLHILKTQNNDPVQMDHSSTSLAQVFYMIVGMTTVTTVISTPWIVPVHHWQTRSVSNVSMKAHPINTTIDSLLLGLQDSTYLIGIIYASSWCLLQLLLQQPIKAIPVLLIFIQILASIFFFSSRELHYSQWAEVAALHFLGMTGYFGLGNSNSLATIDVAGAFIGISSHSTVLSGILMFLITYASPILSFLSLLVYISTKQLRYTSDLKSEFSCVLQMMIAMPCMLPLVLNSVALTAYSFILLLMRNHLFIWSVFSPKFLYSIAATVSVYTGISIVAATGFYACTVLFLRVKLLHSRSDAS